MGEFEYGRNGEVTAQVTAAAEQPVVPPPPPFHWFTDIEMITLQPGAKVTVEGTGVRHDVVELVTLRVNSDAFTGIASIRADDARTFIAWST